MTMTHINEVRQGSLLDLGAGWRLGVMAVAENAAGQVEVVVMVDNARVYPDLYFHRVLKPGYKLAIGPKIYQLIQATPSQAHQAGGITLQEVDDQPFNPAILELEPGTIVGRGQWRLWLETALPPQATFGLHPAETDPAYEDHQTAQEGQTLDVLNSRYRVRRVQAQGLNPVPLVELEQL